jgi:hypothetical protein
MVIKCHSLCRELPYTVPAVKKTARQVGNEKEIMVNAILQREDRATNHKTNIRRHCKIARTAK